MYNKQQKREQINIFKNISTITKALDEIRESVVVLDKLGHDNTKEMFELVKKSKEVKEMLKWL